MTKCHLSRLMGESKQKIIDVARETGLHRNTVTWPVKETAARVDLEATDKHYGFFGVTIGELFERLPDASCASSAQ